jgi:hypothetical protein
MLAASSVPATAATYYVSTTGSDSNSCATAQSAGAPKGTIAAAVACLTAGDTLLIRGGTYTGSNNVVDSERFPVPSGTSWQTAITIAAYPGERVIIRPPDGLEGIRLTTGAPHYLIFSDLELDGINGTRLEENGAPNLIYLSSGAHHNRFVRLNVHSSSASGFALSSNNGEANDNEILDCVIHDNGRLNQTNSGYGIYLKTSNNLIEGNDIYGNNGYGVHHNAAAGKGNNNIIRNNRIHHNQIHGIVGNSGGSSSYAIVLVNGDRNLIVNNLIYANQAGILIYNNTTNALIYNNTITSNREIAIHLQYYGGPPVIKNNIIFNNGSAIVDYGGTGTPVTVSNLTSDPSFFNLANEDFRLTASSAARDRGVDLPEVVRDYAGVSRQTGAYDIGAYEYVTPQGSAAPQAPPAAPQNVRLVNP